MSKERPSIELVLTAMYNPGVEMRVQTHVSTGTDPKTRPGVAFDLIAATQPVLIQEGDKVRVAFGVVDRDQIRALRNLLTDFLLDYPER